MNKQITCKQYEKIMREINKIKEAGMYGHYIVDKDDNIIGEIPDGKYFNKEQFINEVINPTQQYRVYFYPKIIATEIRRAWTQRAMAELDKRIIKLRFIRKQEKNKFLLRHRIRRVTQNTSTAKSKRNIP